MLQSNVQGFRLKSWGKFFFILSVFYQWTDSICCFQNWDQGEKTATRWTSWPVRGGFETAAFRLGRRGVDHSTASGVKISDVGHESSVSMFVNVLRMYCDNVKSCEILWNHDSKVVRRSRHKKHSVINRNWETYIEKSKITDHQEGIKFLTTLVDWVCESRFYTEVHWATGDSEEKSSRSWNIIIVVRNEAVSSAFLTSNLLPGMGKLPSGQVKSRFFV